jgi:hypothetical protein
MGAAPLLANPLIEQFDEKRRGPSHQGTPKNDMFTRFAEQ